jgi:GNAT superfamily N-acetyltransferase
MLPAAYTRHHRPIRPVQLQYRTATPQDTAECIRIRGLTRENAVSAERLASLGITLEAWSDDIWSGVLRGCICMAGTEMAGYCFGDTATGEIVVLALLPAFEGRGIGRELLARVGAQLHALGHQRLFLGCSADPAVRSHGFYRHLGWRSTGGVDGHGDEVLELLRA